jgi:penicillin amidase
LATTDLWGGWGADSRVTNLINLVEAQSTLGADDLKAIIKNIAFYDKRALNIKELLIDAVKYVPKSGQATTALAYLSAWNNLNIDETPKDGFYDDPGSALFNAWWGKAVAATFGSWYEGYQNANGYSAVDILSNLYLGYTLFNRALNGTSGIDYFGGQKGQIIYNALEDALTELNGNYSMPTMMWQFFPVTILGFYFGQPVVSSVGSLPPFPYVDRGTENHIVVLDCKGISGENITPPGNSAFIRADGEISPHFDDQVNMFLNFTYKPMLFKGSEVNGALESTEVLRWKCLHQK